MSEKSGSDGTADGGAARPNIILVITDQHRPDHTGFGGNPIVQTPNLDAIAGRGTRFDRAIVANPICMPNRSTILTSRMPSVHGTRFNGIALDWGANTFVRTLRRAGYRTGLVGKAHFQNMGHGQDLAGSMFPAPGGDAMASPWPAGWDDYENIERHRRERVEMPDDWYGFGEVELVVDHSDRCSGHYHQWLLDQGVDPDSILGPDRRRRSVDVGWDQIYQPGIPEELYPTTFVAQRSSALVEKAAASATPGGGAQPFFLQVSFPDPHHPFTPPGRYYDRYDPASIPLPATFDDPHEASLPHLRRMIEARGSTSPFAVAPFACTETQYREAAAKEYGMISMIDDAIGTILETLDRSGLTDNTIIVFTSDHGDMFGDHGLMLKASMHYQGCVRVPLVIARPKAERAVTNAFAGSIDLGPTLLELAGCEAFQGMQGHSLVPVLDDPAVSVRSRVLVEEDEMFDLLRTGRPLRMRTVITDHGRLTRYEHVAEAEVFDFVEDPDELHNLFGRPEARDLQLELMTELADAMIEHADDAPRPTHFV